MTDLAQNDKAFIKIASELIQKQNDLEALQKLETIASGLSEYARRNVNGTSMGKYSHSDEYQGLGRAVELLGDANARYKAIEACKGRIAILKDLAETYLRGQDIVARRLEME